MLTKQSANRKDLRATPAASNLIAALERGATLTAQGPDQPWLLREGKKTYPLESRAMAKAIKRLVRQRALVSHGGTQLRLA